MSDQYDTKLRTTAVKSGNQVISAWFHDEKFRKACSPDPTYFINEIQKGLVELMQSRGPDWANSESYLAEAAKHPKIKKNGGYSVIEALIHGTPTATDPWKAYGTLRVVYLTRQLRRMTSAALLDPEAGADLGVLQKRLSEALNASVLDATQNVYSIRDVIEASFENSTQVQGKIVCSTGYVDIDKATGQLRRKMNWLIGAESNAGKSTFAVYLIWLALLAGRRPLLVSSEDPEELYGDRMIALIGKIDAAAYRDGKMSKEDFARVQAVRAKYQSFTKPFFIKANGRPVEQIAGEIASYCAGEDIDLVICDWLQSFLTAQNFGPNRRLQVTHIGKTLFDVVRNANAAGVFLSQLTKIAGEKSPTGSWIRDSKDLIQMSDVCLIGTYDKEQKPPYRGMKVEKVKNGWSGFEVPLNFNTRSACFEPDEESQRELDAQLTANEMADFLDDGPQDWDRYTDR